MLQKRKLTSPRGTGSLLLVGQLLERERKRREPGREGRDFLKVRTPDPPFSPSFMTEEGLQIPLFQQETKAPTWSVPKTSELNPWLLQCFINVLLRGPTCLAQLIPPTSPPTAAPSIPLSVPTICQAQCCLRASVLVIPSASKALSVDRQTAGTFSVSLFH